MQPSGSGLQYDKLYFSQKQLPENIARARYDN